MFNMNASSLLSVAETGTTPRTPEILNSLIAMTNPFDRLRPATSASQAGTPSSPPSESGSSAGSPPSVQHTCSQLIKEGLKLTIQTKRRNNGDMSPSRQSLKYVSGRLSPDSLNCDTSNDGLTPEDEERRRRRRERNKIAATKCRLKKRERTVNLVYESEILETQNLDLKSKIQELENQRRRLVDILSVHRTNCSKQPFPGTSSFQDYSRSSQPLVEAHSSYSNYSGPSSSYHHEVSYNRGIESSSIVEEASSSSYLHHHQATSYSSYKNRDPVISYNRTTTIGEPVYTNLSSEVRCFSTCLSSVDGSPNYSRPSTLIINTSSSDYESNTELVDSPNTHHHPTYSFDDEASFNASFTTSSCIT